jgi:hypothetical protein
MRYPFEKERQKSLSQFVFLALPTPDRRRQGSQHDCFIPGLRTDIACSQHRVKPINSKDFSTGWTNGYSHTPWWIIPRPKGPLDRSGVHRSPCCYHSDILTISCKELLHAHLCLRLAFPGTGRHHLADHRLAFPPASPGSPGGPAQGPATAETAYAS